MRAYAIHRPITIGTWPSQYAGEIVNFDHLSDVPEIGRRAFGFIDFAEDVPSDVLEAYELVVPKAEDKTMDMVVRQLWRHVEDEDRFQRIWDKAIERYGYNPERLAEAFDKAYDRYGR